MARHGAASIPSCPAAGLPLPQPRAQRGHLEPRVPSRCAGRGGGHTCRAPGWRQPCTAPRQPPRLPSVHSVSHAGLATVSRVWGRPPVPLRGSAYQCGRPLSLAPPHLWESRPCRPLPRARVGPRLASDQDTGKMDMASAIRSRRADSRRASRPPCLLEELAGGEAHTDLSPAPSSLRGPRPCLRGPAGCTGSGLGTAVLGVRRACHYVLESITQPSSTRLATSTVATVWTCPGPAHQVPCAPWRSAMQKPGPRRWRPQPPRPAPGRPGPRHRGIFPGHEARFLLRRCSSATMTGWGLTLLSTCQPGPPLPGPGTPRQDGKVQLWT